MVFKDIPFKFKLYEKNFSHDNCAWYDDRLQEK
jgi:hypothetical protein